jgi:hypothetical protein
VRAILFSRSAKSQVISMPTVSMRAMPPQMVSHQMVSLVQQQVAGRQPVSPVRRGTPAVWADLFAPRQLAAE